MKTAHIAPQRDPVFVFFLFPSEARKTEARLSYGVSEKRKNIWEVKEKAGGGPELQAQRRSAAPSSGS